MKKVSKVTITIECYEEETANKILQSINELPDKEKSLLKIIYNAEQIFVDVPKEILKG